MRDTAQEAELRRRLLEAERTAPKTSDVERARLRDEARLRRIVGPHGEHPVRSHPQSKIGQAVSDAKARVIRGQFPRAFRSDSHAVLIHSNRSGYGASNVTAHAVQLGVRRTGMPTCPNSGRQRDK